jgi:hypothetical protein
VRPDPPRCLRVGDVLSAPFGANRDDSKESLEVISAHSLPSHSFRRRNDASGGVRLTGLAVPDLRDLSENNGKALPIYVIQIVRNMLHLLLRDQGRNKHKKG